jgi:hypothetical protein
MCLTSLVFFQLDPANLKQLKVYKEKAKEGSIERVQDEYTAIGRHLFDKDASMELYNGMKARLALLSASLYSYEMSLCLP